MTHSRGRIHRVAERLVTVKSCDVTGPSVDSYYLILIGFTIVTGFCLYKLTKSIRFFS